MHNRFDLNRLRAAMPPPEPIFAWLQKRSLNNMAVLWLTPLFPVDYTRLMAQEASAHLLVS
jgi:hypothetical protein